MREKVATVHSLPGILHALSHLIIDAHPPRLYFQFNECHEMKLVKTCSCDVCILVPGIPEPIINLKREKEGGRDGMGNSIY